MANMLTRRQLIVTLAGTTAGLLGTSTLSWAQARGQAPRPVSSSSKPHLTVYKDPSCGCCGVWISYMLGRGYRATTLHVALGPIKQQYSVAPNLQSCHTTLVDGYVVEGHVPESDIVRLLKERPKGIVGLTIPGMPASAPGMDGKPFQPYDVLTFDKAGKTTVWARHTKPGA